VMGINDGLVSTASLMLGVGAGAESLRAMQVRRGGRGAGGPSVSQPCPPWPSIGVRFASAAHTVAEVPSCQVTSQYCGEFQF
jgi:hypothetical protein